MQAIADLMFGDLGEHDWDALNPHGACHDDLDCDTPRCSMIRSSGIGRANR
jgi:hypothetical protein